MQYLTRLTTVYDSKQVIVTGAARRKKNNTDDNSIITNRLAAGDSRGLYRAKRNEMIKKWWSVKLT